MTNNKTFADIHRFQSFEIAGVSKIEENEKKVTRFPREGKERGKKYRTEYARFAKKEKKKGPRPHQCDDRAQRGNESVRTAARLLH